MLRHRKVLNQRSFEIFRGQHVVSMKIVKETLNTQDQIISWLDFNEKISTRYLLSKISRSPYLLPLWTVGNFQIVASVFKAFGFLFRL